MKSCIIIIAMTLAVVPAVASAQEFGIDISTIDSGGGKSEGGRFKVEGTIGQPETGTAHGGLYTFAGGFWSGVQVVQVAGSPQLNIAREGRNAVILTWEDAEDRFALQESGSLKSSEWSASARTIQTIGSSRRMVLTGVTGKLFFRLMNK